MKHAGQGVLSSAKFGWAAPLLGSFKVANPDESRGYAASCNAGVEALRGEGITAVALLNPDVRLQGQSLTELAGMLLRQGIEVRRATTPFSSSRAHAAMRSGRTHTSSMISEVLTSRRSTLDAARMPAYLSPRCIWGWTPERRVRRAGVLLITPGPIADCIGLLLLNAVSQRDLAVVQATAVIVSAVFVLLSLLADVATALLDPRINA